EPECVELSIARWPVIPKAREMTPAREEVYEAAINEHACECDIKQGLGHPEVIVLSTAEAKDGEIVDDHAGPRDERNRDAGRCDESRQRCPPRRGHRSGTSPGNAVGTPRRRSSTGVPRARIRYRLLSSDRDTPLRVQCPTLLSCWHGWLTPP